MNKLLPHNNIVYNKIIKMLNKRNICCIQQPTGTGKSYLIDAISQGRTTLLIAPALSILQQWKTNFGMDRNDITYVTYAGISKYINTKFDLVVFDEFHRTGADVWGNNALSIINNTLENNKWVFGVTATPIHNKTGNMSAKMFSNNIASEISLKEAFNMNILFPPKYIAAQYRIDVIVDDLNNKVLCSSLSTKEKDNLLRKLSIAKNKANDMQGIGKIITDNLPANPKGIIFAKDTNHIESIKNDVAVWFEGKKTNITVVNYKVKNSLELIKEYSEKSFSGTIEIIISVGMLNEGIHAEGTNFCIFLRPTKSNIIYCQQMGRLLTTDKNNTVVIDLVNNIKTLDRIHKMAQLDVIGSNDSQDIQDFSDDTLNPCDIEIIAVDCDIIDIMDQLYKKYIGISRAVNWFVDNDCSSKYEWDLYRKHMPPGDILNIPLNPMHHYSCPEFWNMIKDRVSPRSKIPYLTYN